MRITNKMMTNNMLYNINRNRLNLSKLESQYSSGKRISRPSENPMIAVRSLKLRTDLAELNQYFEKNIPDAKSWMDVTEAALVTANDLLTDMHTQLVQGANDTLTTSDRNSIIENIKQMAAQFYQEGDSDYAGRYVFTGFKTDTSLLFDKATDNVSYSITQHFKPRDIEYMSKVEETSTKGNRASDFSSIDLKNLNPEYMTEAPSLVHSYRIKLAYSDLSNDSDITFEIRDKDGQVVQGITVASKPLSYTDVYNPTRDIVHFIPETGELIFGEDVLDTMRQASDISFTYQKDSFKKDDLRPEHYFDCVKTEPSSPNLKLDMNDPNNKVIHYTKSNQEIQYEVNFNQKLTVNTQAKDAFSHDIKRLVEELVSVSDDVAITEERIREIEGYLEDPNFENKAGLERMLETLKVELGLKNKVLQDVFSKGLTRVSDQQERLNIAVSDLGSRYVRLELTESRLASQQIDFEELLSQNEDVDLVDTIIRYGAAETLYNASLSAAGQIVKTSLLDFIR